MTIRPPVSAALALALLSAGVTAAQIALMQVLEVMQWHHFAYLVVSVALLGFGASGTALSLWRARLLARADAVVPWMLFGTGAGFVVIVPLLQWEWLRFDLYLLFVERAQLARLACACALLAMPFFCAGLATALILTTGVARAGRLYAANLGGAGAGAIAGLALLGAGEPARLLPLVAVAPVAALFFAGAPRRGGFGAALLVVAALTAPPLPLSPFKDLARTLELPDARAVVSKPSAQGWLQIVDAPALRGGPPADLAFTGRVPRQQAVFVDGNRYGSLLAEPATDPDTLAIFAASAEALPWRLGAPRRVLLIHEGGGGEAAFARRQGAREVVLVEPHHAFARVLGERLRDDPAIAVRAEEPRTALARAPNTYDLIRLPTAGAFGGSAGLRAVAEEFLCTREAIADAWHALKPDGGLLVTAWMDHPERTPLRLLATLRAGIVAAGVRDAAVPAHLVAVRGWASVTFLVQRAPLDATAIATVRGFAAAHGCDPLILPGITADERTAHHAWDNPDFFAEVDAICAGRDTEAGAAGALLRLDAPTDDRPYFSQFLKPAAVFTLARTHGWRGLPFFELGSIIVGVSLVVLSTLATVCIVLPLLRRGWRGAGRGWTFGYFAALGAGFMLVEIGLMARLTLFAGGSVAAAAIVVGALLVAAGGGAWWSERLAPARPSLTRVTAIAAVGAAALGLATSWLSPAWNAPFVVRAALGALLIAPVAFVLGQAFPAGLRFLAQHEAAQLPWAWAVNGCVSVVTPSVAVLIAVNAGHGAVFGCAALAYASAAIVTRLALPAPAEPPR